MKAESFISSYERALRTQEWKNLEGLMHDNIAVTFSNGQVFLGKHNVQKAFEKNFTIIKNEQFEISNINWIIKESTFSVYLFEFNWEGIINEKLASGCGIGTSVLIKEDNCWKLLSEHLGKRIS